jgi:hypothetical protein
MIDRITRSLTALALLGGAAMVAVPACGGSNSSEFGDGTGNPDGGDTDGPIFGLDANPDAKPCTNLCLKQQPCPNGGTTSISGSVFDPAGRVPLYNVVVYVPNAPLADISTGASCDKCGTVSGDPVVATITDSAGHFKLDNVPVVPSLPLVMQVGKWRRQVTLPLTVNACADNPLTTPALQDLTRLPKNHTEGNIPLIALTTGGADALECFLRKVGIEDAEFSLGGGAGRVHFYAGLGSAGTPASAAFDPAHGGAAFTQAKDFWATSDSLKKYDIVLLSCEGQTFPVTKPQTALQALLDYTNVGGRVFASHWHRFWLHPDPPETSVFTSVGAWKDDTDPTDPSTGFVDDSFPKGKAMKEWLVNVGASTTPGSIPIKQPRNNIASVDNAQAQQWITLPAPQAVEYLSFNTPQGVPDDQKCGRVVYSDLHVSGGRLSNGNPDPNSDLPGQPWPDGCTQPALSPQEKALEFMLFDLSSCIQSDQAPPGPPVK